MANLERIDSAFDVAAIEAEKKAVLKSVDEVTARIKQNAAELSQLGASLQSGNTRGASGAGDTISKQKADVSELAKLKQQLASVEAKLVISLSDQAKQLAALNVQLAENKKQLTESARAQNADYQSRVQSAAAARAESAARKQAAQNAKEEARINAELSSAFKLLTKATDDARKKYQDYAAELGMLHPVTVQAQKDLLSLDKRLSAIREGGNDFRHNVGNYASGFNGLNVAVQQILREAPSAAVSLNTFFLAISNNIPMLIDEINKLQKANKEAAASALALGQEVSKQPSIFKSLLKSLFSVQTALSVGVLLLTLYGKDLIEFTTALIRGAGAVDKARLSFEALSAAYKDSGVKTAMENVEKLRIEIELAKKGFIDKGEVVREYNKTIGQTTGEVKNLTQAELALEKNAEAYIHFTLLKAIANKAFEKSAEKAVDAQLEARERIGSELAKGVTPLGLIGKLFSAVDQKQEESARNAAKTYKEIAQDAFKQAAQIAKDFNFDFFEGKNDPKKGKKAQDLTNEMLSAKEKELEEQKKIDQAIYEENQKALQLIFDDETKSLDERGAALAEFEANRLYIIQAAADAETKAVQLKLDKIAEIEKKSESDRTNEEKVLLLNKVNLQLALQRIQLEKAKEYAIAQADDAAKNTEILESESKKQYKIIKDNLNNIVLAGKEAGLSQEDILQNEISFLDQALKAAGINAEERKKIIEDITNFQIKKQNEVASKSAKQEDVDLKSDKLLAAEKKKIQEDLFNSVSTLGNAFIEKRLSEINAEIQAVNDAKDKRIDAINQSTLSEKEKNQQIAAANADAAQREKQLQAEVAKEKRKQALLNKGLAIVSIAIKLQETLAAIQLATAELNAIIPGSGFVYQATAIPLAIAGAAAQTATVLATPIPAYDKGKDASDRYSGPALMGERKPELLIRKDGSAMFADKPTLFKTYAGDRVFSNDELKNGAAMSYLIGTDDSRNQQQLHEKLDELIYATKRQRPAVVNIYANTTFDKRVNNARA